MLELGLDENNDRKDFDEETINPIDNVEETNENNEGQNIDNRECESEEYILTDIFDNDGLFNDVETSPFEIDNSSTRNNKKFYTLLGIGALGTAILVTNAINLFNRPVSTLAEATTKSVENSENTGEINVKKEDTTTRDVPSATKEKEDNKKDTSDKGSVANDETNDDKADTKDVVSATTDEEILLPPDYDYTTVSPMDIDPDEIVGNENITLEKALPEFKKPTKEEIDNLLYFTNVNITIPSFRFEGNNLVPNSNLELSETQSEKLNNRLKFIWKNYVRRNVSKFNITSEEQLKKYEETIDNMPDITAGIIYLDFLGKNDEYAGVYFVITDCSPDKFYGFIFDINSTWDKSFHGSHETYFTDVAYFKPEGIRVPSQEELIKIKQKLFGTDASSLVNFYRFKEEGRELRKNNYLPTIVQVDGKYRLYTYESSICCPLGENEYKGIANYFRGSRVERPIATIILSDYDYVVITNYSGEKLRYYYVNRSEELTSGTPEIKLEPYPDN